MMKKFAFIAVTIAALGACTRSPAPDPRPDPRLVEKLALSLETPEVPGAEKLRKAEGLVSAVDRSDPDKLAGTAERLLVR